MTYNEIIKRTVEAIIRQKPDYFLISPSGDKIPQWVAPRKVTPNSII